MDEEQAVNVPFVLLTTLYRKHFAGHAKSRLLGFEKVIVVSMSKDGSASQEDGFGQLDELRKVRVESNLGEFQGRCCPDLSTPRTEVFQSHAILYINCDAINWEWILMNMTSFYRCQLLDV
jgi:hypothetical protein